MPENTPRKLIEALYAAKTEAERRALRAQINTRNLVLVPGQIMPEPLEIAEWDEEQERVGSRPQAEILDLLYDGLALTLAVGNQEYSIAWKAGQFIFELWELGDEEDTCASQVYDSLDSLLLAEQSRPQFDLRNFECLDS